MVTAGVLQGLSETSYMQGMKDVNAQSPFTAQLQKNVINNTSGALVNHAINGGDLQQQLQQSLKNTLIDTGAAQGANLIGDMKENGKLDTYTHKLAHAIAGCAAGAAKSDDCRSGALGAVVGEITAEMYAPDNTDAPLTPKQKADTIGVAKIMAGVAAAVTGNDVNLAAAAGGNAAENNWLDHRPPSPLATSEKERSEQGRIDKDEEKRLHDLSAQRDQQLDMACAGGPSPACSSAAKEAILAGNKVYTTPDGHTYAISKTDPEFRSADPYNQRDGTFMQQQAADLKDGLLVAGAATVLIGSSAIAVAGAVDAASTTAFGLRVAGGGLGALANASVQYSGTQPMDWLDVGIGGVTGFMTTGATLLPSVLINTDGALIGSIIKGEDPASAMGGAATGTIFGYGAGKIVEISASKFIQNTNPFGSYWIDSASGMARTVPSSITPVILGNAVSSWTQEVTGNPVKEVIQNGGAK